jgi:hypothetical protein
MLRVAWPPPMPLGFHERSLRCAMLCGDRLSQHWTVIVARH